MANYLNLATNVPNVCTVSKVEFAPGRGTWNDGKPKPDQIVVHGNWETGGESKMFLHMSMEGELSKIGVIGNRDGGLYALLKPGAKVRFTKRENGNSKFTTAELVGQGTVTPQTYQGGVPSSRPGPNKKELWDKTIYTMNLCLKEARDMWQGNFDGKLEYGPDQVAATAHSLFIQMAKADLFRTPPGAVVGINPTQLELIGNFCRELNWEDAKLTQYIVEKFKCQTPNQLSESQGSALVAYLQDQATAKAASKNTPEEELAF